MGTLTRDDGMTLVEIMIAALLTAVAAAIFAGALASVQRALNAQQTLSNANDQVRLAAEQLDREIRSASLLYNPATETLPHFSLRIFASRAAAQRCTQWRIHDRSLQRRTWTASHGATPDPATVSGWGTVAEGIVNRAVTPPVPAFRFPAPAASAGRTVQLVLLANTSLESRPDQTVVIDQVITGRNTQSGSAQVQNACDPVPPA